MANEKSLVECKEITPLQDSIVNDKIPQECADDGEPSLKRVDTQADLSWLKEHDGKTGIGQSGLCDPLQSGRIIKDDENSEYGFRYTKAIRGADEAMLDMFSQLVVIDENATPHKVPILYATQERAVAAVLQDNVRKDNTLVVDRIRLPIMAIHQKDVSFAKDRFIYHRATDYLRKHDDGKPGFTHKERFERDTVFGVTRGLPVDIGYTLYAWTLYKEDMNQIVEQVMLKFSPIAYIRIRGVYWEVGVTLDSVANNEEAEPGDKNLRVIKWQFNMTAQTYIPQPIIRKKAVLKTKIDFVDGIREDEITKVIDRLRVAVKELKC